MSCRHCRLKLQKGERFVVVGEYPSLGEKWGFSWLFDGLEHFGDLYHEVCYLESVGKHQAKTKEGVKP